MITSFIRINPINNITDWNLTAPCTLEWEGTTIPQSVSVSVETGIEDLALAILNGLRTIFVHAKKGIRERVNRAHRYDIWVVGSRDYPLILGLHGNLVHLAEEIKQMNGLISHEKFYGISSVISELSNKIDRTCQTLRPLIQIYNFYTETYAKKINLRISEKISTLDGCIRCSNTINALQLPQPLTDALHFNLKTCVLRIFYQLPSTSLASIEQFLRVVLSTPYYSFSPMMGTIRAKWLQACEHELRATNVNLNDLLINLRNKLLYDTITSVSTTHWEELHLQRQVSDLLMALLNTELDLEKAKIQFPQRKIIYCVIMPQVLNLELTSLDDGLLYRTISRLISDAITSLVACNAVAINNWNSNNAPRKTFTFSQGSLPDNEINYDGVCSGLTFEWSRQLIDNPQQDISELPNVSAQTRYFQVATNFKRALPKMSSSLHSRNQLSETLLANGPTLATISRELIGVNGHFHIIFWLKNHDCSELPYGNAGHVVGIKLDSINKKFLFWDVNRGCFTYKDFWEFENNFSEYFRLFYSNTFDFRLYKLQAIKSNP